MSCQYQNRHLYVLTGIDRLMYLQALETLHPHGMPLGAAAGELTQRRPIFIHRFRSIRQVGRLFGSNDYDVKDEVIDEALRLMDGECRRLLG